MLKKNSMNQREITLKEYIDTRLLAIEKETILARDSMNTRLESMNAFREQINRIEGTLVTRVEYETKIESIKNDKTGSYALWIGVISMIVSIVLHLIK
jgi:hypothetical protein